MAPSAAVCNLAGKPDYRVLRVVLFVPGLQIFEATQKLIYTDSSLRIRLFVASACIHVLHRFVPCSMEPLAIIKHRKLLLLLLLLLLPAGKREMGLWPIIAMPLARSESEHANGQ